MTRKKPTILVFDVNETLLDLATLEPFFERLFGDTAVMRQWFAELILYSEVVTLTEHYVPFGKLAAGCLRMVGAIRGAAITDGDEEELIRLVGTMPAHPDVLPGLERLRDVGFRMATLTNSAPGPSSSPLERAGLASFFERSFSVDAVRRFKPDRAVYDHVARELDTAPTDLCLVACHTWDTIGAQAAGWQGALLTRAGNAVLPVDGLPVPTFVASDLDRLASQLTKIAPEA